MRQLNKKFLIFISVLFVVLVALQHFVPKPINWDFSFSYQNKNPYGCYAGFNMLEEIFPGEHISINSASYYAQELLAGSKSKNIIVVTNSFSPDEYDLGSILELVEAGNNLFVSALTFSEGVIEKLGFEPANNSTFDNVLDTNKEKVNLILKGVGSDSGFVFTMAMPDISITPEEKEEWEVLGTNLSGEINFASKKFGAGQIWIHTQPLTFTNYHLLYSNYQYASKVLAHLPVQDSMWDEYYKPGRIINTSPVRFILSQEALRRAYYIVLLTLLVYLLFEGKRKQKIIPVIPPLSNTSLEFIQTLGRLYYKSQNHKNIAEKKVLYFKDYIKEKYAISKPLNTEHLAELLVVKSGVEGELVERIFTQIKHISSKETITSKELAALNTSIELFYSKCI